MDQCPEMPVERILKVAPNISKSQLILALEAGGSVGLVMNASELDMISSAMHQENGKQDTDRLGIHDRSRLSYAKIIKKAALKVKAFSRSGTYRSFQKKRQKRDIRVISHAAFQGLFPPAGRHLRQMLLDDFPHHDADK